MIIHLCTQQDPWQAIRCFIEHFNLTRKRNCIPGCHIVVDECMSSWNGADGEFVAEGMPHKTKVARKPEGVGSHRLVEYHIANGENSATPESGQLLTAVVQKNVGGFWRVRGGEVPGGGWRVGGSGAISVCSDHLPQYTYTTMYSVMCAHFMFGTDITVDFIVTKGDHNSGYSETTI